MGLRIMILLSYDFGSVVYVLLKIHPQLIDTVDIVELELRHFYLGQFAYFVKSVYDLTFLFRHLTYLLCKPACGG